MTDFQQQLAIGFLLGWSIVGHLFLAWKLRGHRERLEKLELSGQGDDMTDITQADAKRFSELVRRAMVVLRNLRRLRVLLRPSRGKSSTALPNARKLSKSEIDKMTLLWDEINNVVDSLGPNEDEQLERLAR